MRWLFALLPLVPLGGCALEEEPAAPAVQICVPGAERACLFEETDVGSQTCNSDGAAWGDCEKVVTPIGGCVEDNECPTVERSHCISDVCVGEGGRCREPSDCLVVPGYPNCIEGGCMP